MTTSLTIPWGMTFLPNGSALVGQRRSGEVVRIPTSGGAPRGVGTVPGVSAVGEGGLLGLATSPKFVDDKSIYAYLTTTVDNRVVRMTFDGSTLTNPRVVLKGIPSGPTHDGGRIAFGPDGKLWITTGDTGDRSTAQNRSSLAGKILRVNPDGSTPSDNPFGSPVWAYGIRNSQGIAWDSQGRPWATEFGQSSRDELNLIVRGGNYGWPIVEGKSDDERFQTPFVTWPTDEASPSGVAIIDDVAYVGALRGERVWQVALTGAQAAKPAALFDGEFGRVRSVVAAPDRALWITTSNRDGRGEPRAGDDRVVRLTVTERG